MLIVTALAANQSWLDRHFLPSFFMPRRWYVLIETAARGLVGGLGILLVLGRSRIARPFTNAPGMALQVVAAAILAVVAGNFALGALQLQPTEWLRPDEEPQRQVDSRLGWVLTP